MDVSKQTSAQTLLKDERIMIYLKNSKTGDLIDYDTDQTIPPGYIIVKRIYRKRNIKVLMDKFRAAVEVAKFIGRIKMAVKDRK